ncbi:hypothetical protein V1477_000127 [Vespula maculifrons]|uniref:Uncharacterized protein n=1 Tax=Vespula maculifrons TaxID=7453 RepID=A0ABD2D2T8_VESMC
MKGQTTGKSPIDLQLFQYQKFYNIRTGTPRGILALWQLKWDRSDKTKLRSLSLAVEESSECDMKDIALYHFLNYLIFDS